MFKAIYLDIHGQGAPIFFSHTSLVRGMEYIIGYKYELSRHRWGILRKENWFAYKGHSGKLVTRVSISGYVMHR